MIECQICWRRGNSHLEHDNFRLTGEDNEPPPKSDTNSSELCLSSSRDLCCALFGGGVSPQSRLNFGSLVYFGGNR